MVGCSEYESLTSTNALSVVALPEQTVDTADWECETSLGGTAKAKVSDQARQKRQTK